MFIKILIVVLSVIFLSKCQEVHTNEDDTGFEIYKCVEVENCNDNCDAAKCECNNSIGYYYNETTKGCHFNLKKLLITLTERYNTQDQIRDESIRAFRGIMTSVIFVVTCATIGLLSACVYCCRINYIDRKLNSDINALAEKLHRTGKSVTKQHRDKRLLPKEESCNVVVGEAGLFVV